MHEIPISFTVEPAMLRQINGLALLIWGSPNIVNCTVARSLRYRESRWLISVGATASAIRQSLGFEKRAGGIGMEGMPPALTIGSQFETSDAHG